MNCQTCFNALEADEKITCNACLSGQCDGCSYIDYAGELTPDFTRTDGTWFCDECKVSYDDYDPQFDDRLEDDRTGN